MDRQAGERELQKKTVVGQLEAVILFAKSIEETENTLLNPANFQANTFTIRQLFAYAYSSAYKDGRH